MHCQRLLIAAVCAFTVVCLSLTLTHAAPVALAPIRAYPLDAEMLQSFPKDLQVLDVSEFDDDLPPKVDYSEHVTFTRCQDWGGGCMTYTALHITDMLKEWEHPYTPDLSWRYALNTFLDKVDAGIAAGWTEIPDTTPDMLMQLLTEGVSPEGLCRTETDLLTAVYRPAGMAMAAADGTSIRDWKPDPSAEAVAAAQLYKANISGPIAPEVQALRAMLHHYGPIWSAGGWWWGGGHVMTFVGYDDDTREFRYLNSQGDWWGSERGFGTIPYDKLTEYVTSLRIVTNTPTPGLRPGHHAYSARITINGVWRGTHTISIGVVGREPLVVWKSHGRMGDRVFEYGQRLTIDVPLPDYAPECWPPSPTKPWVLRVEDNDRDGATGVVREFTLARRYSSATCKSIGRIQTETYGGPMSVQLQDPATGPQVPQRTSNPHFTDWHDPNPNPGVTNVRVPAQGASLVPRLSKRGRYMLNMPAADATVNDDGKPVFHGQLLYRATPLVPWAPVPNKRVSIHRLQTKACINMPAHWMRQGTRKTDADGRFEFTVKHPPAGFVQHYWAAGLKGANDQWLTSSEVIAVGIAKDELMPEFHHAIPEVELPFPDLRAPMQDVIQPVILRQIAH